MTRDRKEYQRAWAVANRERLRERRRQYYLANREHFLEQANADHIANRERNLERMRARYAANRDDCIAAAQKSHADNRDHRLEMMKAAYAANREERCRQSGEYWRRKRAENPDKLLAQYRRKAEVRRARKMAVVNVPFTPEQWAAKVSYWGDRCWRCGGSWSAQDHVKPIAAGGAHMLCNLRPICKPCNSGKGAKWPLAVIPTQILGA